MDEFTYSNAAIKDNGSDRDRSRFERWLGVSGADDEATPSVAPQPSARLGRDSQRGSSRFERWLGVSSPGGDAARPSPSSFADRSVRTPVMPAAGTGPSKYAVPAVVALTAGLLGLGVWTLDLRGQVSSLRKAVAAESSVDAGVTRQLNEAEADLERIDARLNEVERVNAAVGTIDTRLAEVERRIGRRR